MATVKKGTLTRAGEWWVHLRPYGKRDFWKGERKAAKAFAKTAMDTQYDTPEAEAAMAAMADWYAQEREKKND